MMCIILIVHWKFIVIAIAIYLIRNFQGWLYYLIINVHFVVFFAFPCLKQLRYFIMLFRCCQAFFQLFYFLFFLSALVWSSLDILSQHLVGVNHFFKKVFCVFLYWSSKRRRRDLNPCAAINGLLTFQASPFSHLGTSPSILLLLSKNYRAEKVGFEPTVPFGITGFQDRLLKPLGHLSMFKIARFLTGKTYCIINILMCQQPFFTFLNIFL